MIKVSIIVPCRTLEEAERCVEECLKLEYRNKEIIVLPDRLDSFVWYEDGLKTIPTGKVLPSHKRDIGIDNARGEIIAFIDADAYPPRKWLNNAVHIMETNKDRLAGVCGAGVLPQGSSFMETASDYILRLLPYNYRVIRKHPRFVDDFPTFNLILWKRYIDEVGGFNCDYLTGEDTILCKKIIERTGKKILYNSLVTVYHARRPLFKAFLKQVSTYGKHRGYFFKVHPATSRKLVYILPSAVLCLGVLSLLLLVFLCLLRRMP